MDTSETDAMLQEDNLSSDSNEDIIVEGSRKQPKESSSIMALQILVPFLLAGFGTVSAGMVLDIVQVGICFERWLFNRVRFMWVLWFWHMIL